MFQPILAATVAAALLATTGIARAETGDPLRSEERRVGKEC